MKAVAARYNHDLRKGEGTFQWILTLGDLNEEPERRLTAAQGILLVIGESWYRFVWSGDQLPFILEDRRRLLAVIEWLLDIASKNPTPGVKDRALRLLRQFDEYLHNYQYDKDPDFRKAMTKLRKILSNDPSVDDAPGSE